MRRDKNGQFLSNKGIATQGMKRVKQFDLLKDQSMEEEMYNYVSDEGNLDDFRTVWDNGLELSQINQENQIEAREQWLREAWLQFEVLEEQKEKASQWMDNVSFVIQFLGDKVTKHTNELVTARKEYARMREYFIKNSWIFTSKKALPDWAMQKVMEDNLDIIASDGNYIKMLLARAEANQENLIEEVEFCQEFNISDVGYFLARQINLQKRITFVENNLEYDIRKLDGSFESEEEQAKEFFVTKPKEYLEDKNDEFLCLLISTSEDGRGVYKAEQILDDRMKAYISRVQEMAKEAEATVCDMQTMYAAAEALDRAQRLSYEVSRIESREIVREDRTEVRRVKKLADDSERMVPVVQDKVWYYKGKETSNPDKVDFGYTEIIFVPASKKMDALRNYAFEALSGTAPINANRMEDVMDMRLGLLSLDEVREALVA